MNLIILVVFSVLGVSLSAEIGARSIYPPFSEGLIPLTDGKSRAVIYWASTFAADSAYADYYCRQSGRNLVSIETDTEQTIIERFLNANGITGTPWISGNDIKTEGTWVWGTGIPLGFTNFSPTQADSLTENCLTIATASEVSCSATFLKFDWIKANCQDSNIFLCESGY